MAALLGQGAARRLGSSMIQRALGAVTDDRRRQLLPRLIHTKEGAGQGAIDKWEDRRLRFKRFDSQFTKVLNSVAGVYIIYAILACGESPPWPIKKYRLKGEEDLDEIYEKLEE